MTSAIHHPREYFAAAVIFACRISQIANMSILDAIAQYTGLYREVTGRQGLEGGIDPLWSELAGEIVRMSDAEAITELLYTAYLAQPHSRYVAGTNELNAEIFGALGYVYDAANRQARMHFFAQRAVESPLSSRQIPARRDDFRRLLLHLQSAHLQSGQPEAATIKSSTWLHNLPNYRNLFPHSFQARLKNIGGSTYIGVWGQFVKADGHGNQARLDEFQAALMHAQRVEEAIRALPLKVYEAVGPVQEFYAAYGLAAR